MYDIMADITNLTNQVAEHLQVQWSNGMPASKIPRWPKKCGSVANSKPKRVCLKKVRGSIQHLMFHHV